MRWASSQGVSPSTARQGRARTGRARLGTPRLGSARQGSQTVARRGLPSLPSSMDGCGDAGLCKARRGLARRGMARLGKGHRRWHRALRGSLPSSMDGCGTAWPGWACRGPARRSTAWQGEARQGQRGGYSPRCLHCAQLCGLKLDCSRVHRRWQHGPVG
jgi:hypothetical protein